MTDDLNQQYYQVSTDWRYQLKKNQRRTRVVILIFILIYVAIGLLIDMYIYSGQYPQVSLSKIFTALITFRITPYVTFITAAIAIISIFVTFKFHDRLMLLGTEYHEITPETARTFEEKQFYNIVEEMKVAAGLRFMPKVFIIEADYMNAFASGYSEKSAMVAITRGLLEKLNRSETQAVMAHEMSHIKHMDIKLTLMASVLANLLLIMIDIMFWGVFFSRNRRSSEGGGNWLALVIVLLRFILPLITILLMLFLSRTREYMADAGCVELMRDNEPLARALLKIQGDHEANAEHYAEAYQSTPHESVRHQAYIFDPVKAGISARSGMSDLFSTHPGIGKRLAALGFKSKE